MTTDSPVPSPAEVAAYREALVRMWRDWQTVIDDAARRGESLEVLTRRLTESMAALALDVDEASLAAVDAYLFEVEDGSPIRPMRRALLISLLAEVFGDDRRT